MYICYLDESGSVENDGHSINFVYAGLAIPASTWKEKDNQITQIKKGYGLENSEIHTAWLIRKYTEQIKILNFENFSWEDRRREVNAFRQQQLVSYDIQGIPAKKRRSILKSYRETEAYIHLTLQERHELVAKICDAISAWEDSRVFFHAIKTEHYDITKNHAGGVYEDAFCQVLTRFQSFLENVSRNSPVSYGLLVSDNNDSMKKRLTNLTRKFHREGALWRDIPNIVETPLFVDSQQTSMIQLADVVSVVLRKYFDGFAKKQSSADSLFFSKIEPRFGRHRGNLETGRHFSPHEQCQCKVCKRVARDRYKQHTKPVPNDS